MVDRFDGATGIAHLILLQCSTYIQATLFPDPVAMETLSLTLQEQGHLFLSVCSFCSTVLLSRCPWTWSLSRGGMVMGEREEGGRGGARLATDREMRITYILGDPVRCNRLFCYLVNERIRAGLLVCWFFAATRESDSCNLYGRNFQRCFGK